ncbi:hypothetical protein NHX12_032764 [Muraenolepis orangiensis]|uniref:Uncharacterized protein n=1 Tax=Muraenolepis orangiensis TaxID=630683 RepID=A0A9Q0E1E6_9TELE|nr:hypothetical protein NHX12_032764 [Muraenolepis orangiensis]
MDSVVDSLRAEIALVREGAQESMNNLQATSTAHKARLVEVEKCAAFCDNTATELLTKFDKLKCEVTDLQNKCDDLEGRQRRNNIRVLGVPEGVEGPHPTEYMADLLGDLLQLVDKPVLDRAHRSSRAKARVGEPPLPFVIRVHHFQTKELILRKSRAAVDSSFQVGIGFPFFRIWPRLSRKNVQSSGRLSKCSGRSLVSSLGSSSPRV